MCVCTKEFGLRKMHLIELQEKLYSQFEEASSSWEHTEMEADSKQQWYLTFALLTLETQ